MKSIEKIKALLKKSLPIYDQIDYEDIYDGKFRF
jgi:hypothetical protein